MFISSSSLKMFQLATMNPKYVMQKHVIFHLTCNVLRQERISLSAFVQSAINDVMSALNALFLAI